MVHKELRLYGRELATSPLMLDVMSLAYKDVPADDLFEDALAGTGSRKSHLFTTFVNRMLSRRGQTDDRFSRSQTLHWLTWLARKMKQHSQTTFATEQLQPSWLSSQRERWLYVLSSRMIGGLFAGLGFSLLSSKVALSALIFGITVGLAVGVIDALRFENGSFWRWLRTRSRGFQRMMNVSVVTLTAGAIIDLWSLIQKGVQGPVLLYVVSGMVFGVVPGLLWGLRGSRQSAIFDIQPVEALSWSWERARKFAFRAALAGPIIGLFFGLLFMSLTPSQSIYEKLEGLLFEVIGVGLMFGILIGLIGLVFGGLSRRSVETKTRPNQGILLSIKNAIWGGSLVGIVFGVVAGLFAFFRYFGPGPPRSEPETVVSILLGTLFIAAGAGVFGALWYGGLDVIQHYVLRFILILKNRIPRRLVPFMNHVTSLIFLRRVGGGYMFIHRLILEHFAKMDEDELVSSTRSQQMEIM